MVNQFKDTIYTCDVATGDARDSPKYNCMYASDLQSQGEIRGTAVLSAYHYSTDRVGEWIGIMIAIIAIYRIMGYLAHWVRND